MYRRKLMLIFMILAAALLLNGCGQNSQPGPEPDQAGAETCFSCHSDATKLLADLDANPLPEKLLAESEGEG
jgi:PBP1b-binding outer membrane lipoprotein LpoB